MHYFLVLQTLNLSKKIGKTKESKIDRIETRFMSSCNKVNKAVNFSWTAGKWQLTKSKRTQTLHKAKRERFSSLFAKVTFSQDSIKM
jgi:hypothetical protein